MFKTLEGLTLMFHFALSALLIGGYIYCLIVGVESKTLEYAVIGVIGYWFGVTSKTGISLSSKKEEKKS